MVPVRTMEGENWNGYEISSNGHVYRELHVR